MLNTDIKEVATQIKNKELVKERRRQIVDAAVPLFIERGYHKTTTRALAQATGLSIGSMYEYISTKDDVLYLVCIAIHAEVEEAVKQALGRELVGKAALAEVIREYFLVCNRMSDHILLMYQATHFLPPKWQKKVLEAELRITDIFIKAMRKLKSKGMLPELRDDTINLMGHNISVLGHTWSFRRWYFAKNFTIEQYIEQQTDFIMRFLVENPD
ncbi:TetR/AcrR family transcriptional regulator [Desulfofustis limnaeus]|jgi:AcrR family transcriptional regulator|uniref:TetR family transcriptional regulator n=1 Tax=Desulfofustis limnaeus TaxID=2740163 RepID=A0ABM7WDD0_9BACT|nr:TetR/AcrR family transcriptional regulator [Desulfofustis limnaeus]MDX9894016.1 TetR/AcrR family transcriptional regulator [Desulfofustis sp.]BDD88961.1 TetR family transcriptional regulator [Desulfofustis limnaeus]